MSNCINLVKHKNLISLHYLIHIYDKQQELNNEKNKQSQRQIS